MDLFDLISQIMNFVNNENLFKVLNQFLTANFHLKSETYLELLISHLAKPESKGKISRLFYSLINYNNKNFRTELTQLPLVADWIEKSINQIDTNQPQNNQVYAFTLRLLAIVIENDSTKFDHFQTKNIFVK